MLPSRVRLTASLLSSGNCGPRAGCVSIPGQRGRDPGDTAVNPNGMFYLRVERDEMLFDIPNDPGERSDLNVYQPRALTSLREEFGQWNDKMLPRPS